MVTATRKTTEIKIPISMMSEPEHILDRYRELVRAGQSPGMASILATRCAPGIETATNHYSGLRPLHETCGADYAAGVYKQARKAGIPANEHSVYNASIADHRRGGDPNAWVHNGESPDKLRRTCEERGMTCEDLRTKVDTSRRAESEAKREARINRKNAALAARAEAVADKKKKLGIPV